MSSEGTPAFSLEETGLHPGAGSLLGHACTPLPQWQSAELSELSLSQSHLSATAIKLPFISTITEMLELGGCVPFIFGKKSDWISQKEEVEWYLACWRCLWVPALFLLSLGSCDIVN